MVRQLARPKSPTTGQAMPSCYSGGIFTDLGTLGGLGSQADGINTAGQIVGWANLPDGSQHAFLWSNAGHDGPQHSGNASIGLHFLRQQQ